MHFCLHLGLCLSTCSMSLTFLASLDLCPMSVCSCICLSLSFQALSAFLLFFPSLPFLRQPFLFLCSSPVFQIKKIIIIRDFPGGSMVKNPFYSAGNMGSIPDQGTKISHTSEQLSLCTTARVSVYLGERSTRMPQLRLDAVI